MNNLFTFSSGYLERWNLVNHQVIGSDVGKLGICFTRASFFVIIHSLKHTQTQKLCALMQLQFTHEQNKRLHVTYSLMFISGHTPSLPWLMIDELKTRHSKIKTISFIFWGRKTNRNVCTYVRSLKHFHWNPLFITSTGKCKKWSYVKACKVNIAIMEMNHNFCVISIQWIEWGLQYILKSQWHLSHYNAGLNKAENFICAI